LSWEGAKEPLTVYHGWCVQQYQSAIHPQPSKGGAFWRRTVSEVIIAPLLEITFIASFANRFFAR